jgi:hypothetical protein
LPSVAGIGASIGLLESELIGAAHPTSAITTTTTRII